jgi:3-hydroxyacyl-CoA dehydrogenase/enoyl-CoA hydratase/3-hydroxybutyryl-CoA epimerase
MAHDPKTFRHWDMCRDKDGIVWLRLDCADKNVNTLSREVLNELAQLVDEIAPQRPAGAVICSGKPTGFIAGADVTEFVAFADPAEALKLVEWVHSIFNRFEQLPFPTACLISGFCLGGGLELALTCRYRIAVDRPDTKLGLPEVRLGIHPGFGGTVRLVRRIGVLPALSLMLSGKRIGARQACKIGLVDYAVPERQMKSVVREAILSTPSFPRFRFLDSLSKLRFIRRLVTHRLRRAVAKHAAREYYPAPYALLDLWERFGGNPAVMGHEEALSVANLVTGATAQNLVRAFLLKERMKALGRVRDFSPRFVHVIGAGIMGADIAAWCALQGFRVTLQDVEHQRLAGAVKRASGLFRRRLQESGRVEEVLDRLVPDLRGDGIDQADIVIEAIFEDAAAKQKLYEQIESRMRRDALLATNTSSIPLEDLAQSLTNPERFLGLHFFNPVEKMELVEVVHGKATGLEGLQRATSFIAAISRLPLPVASSPGFLINRILMPYLLEAVIMEQEGIPAAAIDRAACRFGMPMGPILLADTVGLDICLAAMRILAGHFQIDVPKRLENLVALGRLGKKSGSGFYHYKKGSPAISRAGKGTHSGKEIEDRLMLRLFNEAIACWREGIVADGDLLDAGAIFGIGFAPFRGGPLHHIRKEGAETLHARLRNLEERYGNRFAADPGWSELMKQEFTSRPLTERKK